MVFECDVCGIGAHVWGNCSCLCVMVQKAKEDIGCCALPISVLFLIPKVSWRLEWPNGHLSLTPTASGHQHILSHQVFYEDAEPNSYLYICMVSILSHWPIHPVTIIQLSILDALLVGHYCVALNFISLMMNNIDFFMFFHVFVQLIWRNFKFQTLLLIWGLRFWLLLSSESFLYIFNLSSLLHISYMILKYCLPFIS